MIRMLLFFLLQIIYCLVGHFFHVIYLLPSNFFTVFTEIKYINWTASLLFVRRGQKTEVGALWSLLRNVPEGCRKAPGSALDRFTLFSFHKWSWSRQECYVTQNEAGRGAVSQRVQNLSYQKLDPTNDISWFYRDERAGAAADQQEGPNITDAVR